MKETILNVNSLNTKMLSNLNTVIDSISNDLAYHSDKVLYSCSIDQSSNTSVHIEKTSHSSPESTIHNYKVNALEQLLYSLLKEGNTTEAKSVLEKFKNYSSPLIDKWKASFSKSSPKKNTTASLKKDEIEIESKLIKKYKNNYISQWVALVSEKIVASNNDLSELKKEIKSLHMSGDITFLKL